MKELLTAKPTQLLIIAIVCLSFYSINLFQLDEIANRCLSIAILMIFLWISEILPLPVVALIPLMALPLFGVQKIEEIAPSYANPVIFLFMGGFFLSLAIEKWNLHKRIALNIVRITGTSGNRIILGFIISTAFISMWLSNTATTMMMFPIALSVINVVRHESINEKQTHYFTMSILLSIAYASNFGGLATIIGTPPNVAFVSFLDNKYNYSFSFFDWMKLCLPLSIVLLIILYFLLVKVLFPNHIESKLETKEFLHTSLQELGSLSNAEKKVLMVFSLTVSLWIFKDLINKLLIYKIDDSMIALFGSFLLFVIPAKDSKESLLQWKDTAKMSWGILVLFGGGIALANSLEKAGILKLFGVFIAQYSHLGLFPLMVLVALISIFLSEVMSNVAQVIVLSPIVCTIADALGISPLLLGMPMVLGASCASMLPMGTPPNAIAFSSGEIPLKQMIKTGFTLNIICLIVISLFCYYLMPYLVKLP
ncbi:MAG: DASS family sodium-coupled anion symporter [Bacteroidota bacterium]|nr:DASS family sodium-coupled anion symporter [Bacteroidota bacterium]